MVISYFRAGGAAGQGQEQDTRGVPVFHTQIGSTGAAQRQLLLDFEEDRIFVIREVARSGSIGGHRIWPNALVPEESQLLQDDQRCAPSDDCA
jgi:hypothetical protein